MGRKLGIGIGSLLATLLGLLIAFSLFVNVDQYRPQVVAFVNDHIDGELSIGKLSLSLWGEFAVDVNGIALKDQRGKTLLAVDEASAVFPFSSLFGGQPKLTLRLAEPDIHVVRSRDAKINLLSILKSQSMNTGTPSKKSTSATQKSASSDLKNVPFLDTALAAGVNLEIEDAKFLYEDDITGLKQAFHDLNLSFQDVSLQRTMRMSLWTDVDTKLGADLRVEGPLRVLAKVVPQFEQVQFKKADLQLAIVMDDLMLNAPGSFAKKAGEPANMKLAIKVSPQSVELADLQIRFLQAKAQGTGTLSGMQSPPENLRFDLTAANPGLDLKLGLDLRSLAAPQVKVDVQAKDIDLDVLLPAPPGGRIAGKKHEEKKGGAASLSSEETPLADVDAMLEPVRKSSFFRNMGADISVKVERLKGFQFEAKQLVVDASFRNLIASLSRFSVQAFGGNVQASSRVDLKPRMPGYRFEGEIRDVVINDAVATYLESFRNTVKGKLSASVKGFGRSFNSDTILTNLNVEGGFKFQDAQFATIDVGRMVREGLNQSAEKIKKKVPQLSGQSFKELPEETSEYEYLGGSFMLQNSVFRARNFEVRAVKGKGVDLKGTTLVNLVKDELKAEWFVIDRHDYLGMKGVGLKEKGVSIPSVFLKPGQSFQFPVTVGCALSAPCYKYAAIPDFLSAVALNNLSRGLKGVADEKIQAAKKELNQKIEQQKKRLQNEKKRRLAELEKKKKQAERQAKQKLEKEAEKKLKGKAKDKAMDALKKLGL